MHGELVARQSFEGGATASSVARSVDALVLQRQCCDRRCIRAITRRSRVVASQRGESKTRLAAAAAAAAASGLRQKDCQI